MPKAIILPPGMRKENPSEIKKLRADVEKFRHGIITAQKYINNLERFIAMNVNNADITDEDNQFVMAMIDKHLRGTNVQTDSKH